MKYMLNTSVRRIVGRVFLCLLLLSIGSPAARAGLSLEMNMYLTSQGQTYVFYTPLTTNAIAPAAAAGTYIINSPGWPASGSRRGFEMTTTNVLIDRTEFDSEHGYGDFNSALQQITNGAWTILFTNAISTNLYTFRVSALNFTSNMLPATVITFPLDGSRITTSQTNFTWQGPANWPVSGFVYVTGPSYFDGNNFPASATNWVLPNPPPVNTGYSFNVNFVTNFVSNIFNVSTPTNNVGGAPISGWTSTAVISSGSSVSFDVFEPGAPSSGHTNLAYYSFEDDSLFAHDFSGHGNDINSYGNYSMSPFITNDAAAGSYAFGSAGDGWLYPPTNLLATLAGSFTVSLWLRTVDVHGSDSDGQYSAAGIVSAFNGSGMDVMPMGLTGGKLAFYTGGSLQNILHSQASINTGQYVHLVVTRDQQTGEKRIYVNGVLDSSTYASTDLLTGSDGLTIGYNNGQPFTGDLDEIQFYSGVLSDAEVASLYANPGTTVPDVTGGNTNGLVVHYDFDEDVVLAPDVSGNNNNIVHAGNFGGSGPSISTDTAAGSGSISFDGGSYLTAPATLLPVLATNFTISLWLNTTQDNGDPDDYAFTGAGIISADVPGLANDLVPVALTGGQVAFNTGDTADGYDDTINSYATVNDGAWHHVVVSRNQITGEKDIYIDGVLDTSDFNTTALLNAPMLLTIGAIADASNPDPSSPDDTGYNGYQGLLDDVQIYSRVLNSDEVSFLYNNPGATLATFSPTPYPVDVSLQLTIARSQDPNLGEYFDASVSFNSVNPAPTTTNSVQSPNNYYSSAQYPSGGYGSSVISGSLGDVLNECTNGFWKIYINEGSPTQEVYSFQVSISGLDTNLLKAVKVFSPTNGAVNVTTNPVYFWNGPANYSTLVVDLLSGPVADLSVTATNWPSAPALNYGTNRFDVSYNYNNFPGVTFTTPVDTSSNPVETWNTTVTLNSVAFSPFVVGAPAPLPVLLTNLTRASGNLQFSFKTLAGRPHIVQSRTNLSHGAWINLSNFVGDGSLKQFAFPATNPPVQFFRVLTQ
jgi:hypothetical protein